MNFSNINDYHNDNSNVINVVINSNIYKNDNNNNIDNNDDNDDDNDNDNNNIVNDDDSNNIVNDNDSNNIVNDDDSNNIVNDDDINNIVNDDDINNDKVDDNNDDNDNDSNNIDNNDDNNNIVDDNDENDDDNDGNEYYSDDDICCDFSDRIKCYGTKYGNDHFFPIHHLSFLEIEDEEFLKIKKIKKFLFLKYNDNNNIKKSSFSCIISFNHDIETIRIGFWRLNNDILNKNIDNILNWINNIFNNVNNTSYLSTFNIESQKNYFSKIFFTFHETNFNDNFSDVFIEKIINNIKFKKIGFEIFDDLININNILFIFDKFNDFKIDVKNFFIQSKNINNEEDINKIINKSNNIISIIDLRIVTFFSYINIENKVNTITYKNIWNKFILNQNFQNIIIYNINNNNKYTKEFSIYIDYGIIENKNTLYNINYYEKMDDDILYIDDKINNVYNIDDNIFNDKNILFKYDSLCYDIHDVTFLINIFENKLNKLSKNNNNIFLDIKLVDDMTFEYINGIFSSLIKKFNYGEKKINISNIKLDLKKNFNKNINIIYFILDTLSNFECLTNCLSICWDICSDIDYFLIEKLSTSLKNGKIKNLIINFFCQKNEIDINMWFNIIIPILKSLKGNYYLEGICLNVPSIISIKEYKNLNQEEIEKRKLIVNDICDVIKNSCLIKFVVKSNLLNSSITNEYLFDKEINDCLSIDKKIRMDNFLINQKEEEKESKSKRLKE